MDQWLLCFVCLSERCCGMLMLWWIMDGPATDPKRTPWRLRSVANDEEVYIPHIPHKALNAIARTRRLKRHEIFDRHVNVKLCIDNNFTLFQTCTIGFVLFSICNLRFNCCLILIMAGGMNYLNDVKSSLNWILSKLFKMWSIWIDDLVCLSN